jgi:hypothetical protein
MKRLVCFWAAEDGAVTVDWVVLSAILIGIVMSVFAILTPTVYENAAGGIRDNVVESTQR